MIMYGDVERLAQGDDLGGELNVCGRGCRIARRVVVDQNETEITVMGWTGGITVTRGAVQT